MHTTLIAESHTAGHVADTSWVLHQVLLDTLLGCLGHLLHHHWLGLLQGLSQASLWHHTKVTLGSGVFCCQGQRERSWRGFTFRCVEERMWCLRTLQPAKWLCDASSVLVGVELPISSRFQPSPLASKLLAASRKGEHCASVSPCQFIAYPQQVLCSAFSWWQVLLGTVRPQH